MEGNTSSKEQHRGSVIRSGGGETKLEKWSKSKQRKWIYIFLNWETSNRLDG